MPGRSAWYDCRADLLASESHITVPSACRGTLPQIRQVFAPLRPFLIFRRFANNRADCFVYKVLPAFRRDGDKATIPFGCDNGFPIVDFIFQIPAQPFPQKVFAAAGHGDKLIPVGNQCCMAGYLGKAFRILFGKCTHFPN